MAENKIILFSNLKGGVGKTSLCALFALYAIQKGKGVVAIDADLQSNLSRHRAMEVKSNPDIKQPYSISPVPAMFGKTEEERKVIVGAMMDNAKKIPGYVLIDCPGNLQDSRLVPIFKAADVVVIPLSYEFDVVDSTGVFINVFRQINKNAKLVFAPNRIATSEGTTSEIEDRAKTIEVLGKFGTVAPRIKQSVVIKRYSTLFALDLYQSRAVEHSFDRIINEIEK